MNEKRRYADYTRNTAEPLKAVAHGRRLRQAAELLSFDPSMKVLDYGCGDGGFFYELANFISSDQMYGFDPNYLDQMDFEGATTFTDAKELVELHPREFDVVFCMEVCEHLTTPALHVLWANILAVCKPDATVVFGVPIENGFSGFAKNIYRCTKGGRQNATVGKALKSLFNIPIPRASSKEGVVWSHIGFDHRGFSEFFPLVGLKVVSTACLPFHFTGTILNNEIYYICKLGREFKY